VVGDDAQSIYSFRAATVRNILDFPDQFTRPPTSSRSIATTARRSRSCRRPTRVIDLASERFTKNLWTDGLGAKAARLVTVRDEADQARYIVERVLENAKRRA
jgi:DNA helicase-2/ATP-dependent DNA helicase PcrA